MALSCRFYEQHFPEMGDVVMVNVRSITDMGAYVDLQEYNNIEGMILISSWRRRSRNKLIEVGRSECGVVIRVDKDKGYIDLSKRRVSAEEAVKCVEKYTKAKCVNSILCHVAELLNYESNEKLEELYMKTAWYFDRVYKKTGSSYEAFKQAATNPEVLDPCELDEETKDVLLSNIKKMVTPQTVELRAEVEVACSANEGVDAIKTALDSSLALSTEEMPIDIKLIVPQTYVVTLQTPEQLDGLAKLNAVLTVVERSIKKSNGVFSVKQAPKVVSNTDEAEPAQLFEQLEAQNREVGGDDDQDRFDDRNDRDEDEKEDD